MQQQHTTAMDEAQTFSVMHPVLPGLIEALAENAREKVMCRVPGHPVAHFGLDATVVCSAPGVFYLTIYKGATIKGGDNYDRQSEGQTMALLTLYQIPIESGWQTGKQLSDELERAAREKGDGDHCYKNRYRRHN